MGNLYGEFLINSCIIEEKTQQIPGSTRIPELVEVVSGVMWEGWLGAFIQSLGLAVFGDRVFVQKKNKKR